MVELLQILLLLLVVVQSQMLLLLLLLLQPIMLLLLMQFEMLLLLLLLVPCLTASALHHLLQVIDLLEHLFILSEQMSVAAKCMLSLCYRLLLKEGGLHRKQAPQHGL
jgi:hypothetical protein